MYFSLHYLCNSEIFTKTEVRIQCFNFQYVVFFVEAEYLDK